MFNVEYVCVNKSREISQYPTPNDLDFLLETARRQYDPLIFLLKPFLVAWIILYDLFYMFILYFTNFFTGARSKAIRICNNNR